MMGPGGCWLYFTVFLLESKCVHPTITKSVLQPWGRDRPHLARVLLGLCAFFGVNVDAGLLELEIVPQFAEESLVLGQDYSVDTERSLRFTRLDFLVSGFSLLGEDGRWLDAPKDTVGLVRLGDEHKAIGLGDVPAGDYLGLRFEVGLPPELNRSDPNLFKMGHALNPVTSGLHWGWSGGYIFWALEGWSYEDGERESFSYHLANDGNSVSIELSVSFSIRRNQTLQVPLNLSSLWGPSGLLDPWSGRKSTHSRLGDEVVPLLSSGISRSFGEVLYVADVYQGPVVIGKELGSPKRDVGTPYFLRVSKRLPRPMVSSNNPITQEGVSLGRTLFEDPALSSDGSVSCVSCHSPSNAFSDTIQFSKGIGGQEGIRNAMPLFNLAWAKTFFWDGRVESLAEQVLHPITDTTEMGETLDSVVGKLKASKAYREGFRAAFGEVEITPELIGLAMEQFLLTLVSQDSRFDQAMRGETTFTEQEKLGFSLFTTEHDPENGLKGADCFHCHGGALFVSKDFANNGLGGGGGDLGRGSITGRPLDNGLFKVPSLRNVSLTGPYMHDGRFDSLEQVVEHYNSGVHRSENLDPNIAKHPENGLELSKQEIAAIVAFLETLTDSSFSTNHL